MQIRPKNRVLFWEASVPGLLAMHDDHGSARLPPVRFQGVAVTRRRASVARQNSENQLVGKSAKIRKSALISAAWGRNQAHALPDLGPIAT